MNLIANTFSEWRRNVFDENELLFLVYLPPESAQKKSTYEFSFTHSGKALFSYELSRFSVLDMNTHLAQLCFFFLFLPCCCFPRVIPILIPRVLLTALFPKSARSKITGHMSLIPKQLLRCIAPMINIRIYMQSLPATLIRVAQCSQNLADMDGSTCGHILSKSQPWSLQIHPLLAMLLQGGVASYPLTASCHMQLVFSHCTIPKNHPGNLYNRFFDSGCPAKSRVPHRLH